MRYENDGMTGLNIAYIGGGSSGWARTFMTDLALDGSLSGTVRPPGATPSSATGSGTGRRRRAAGRM